MPPHIKTLDPSSLSSCKPYYSPLSTVQGPVKLIYTAGQVGRSQDGSIAATYEAQVDLAFQNLQECLAAGGATKADIVKLTYYIVNYDVQYRYHSEVLLKFLEGRRPPATLIPVVALAKPEYLFEIEAVAAIRDLQALPPVVRPKEGESLIVDVVVVGAGLSGLQAAYDVQRAGFSCVVLEARGRVGGKTWSRPTKGGSIVDVGAAWINDTNQAKMFQLVKRFGLEVIEQPSDGNCAAQMPDNQASIIFPYGEVPNFSEEDTVDIIRIREMFEKLCHTIDIKRPQGPEYDSVTLEEFMKQQDAGQKALATVAIWTRAMLGCDPSEMSALYFLDYCKSGGGLLQMRSDKKHGGQYLRIRTGTQSFSLNLASSMIPNSIHLSSPVSHISQTSLNVITKTTVGTTYHSKKLILSVPTPTYSSISFSPPLPLPKRQYSTSTHFGYYAKMILLFPTPWWRTSNFCGMTQSFSGPSTVTRDSSDDLLSQFSLTCFIVGSPGRSWSLLSPSERKCSIFTQLVQLFGSKYEQEIRNPTEVFEQEWVKDPWSQGCPCPVAPPGAMKDGGKALREKFWNVHFVGTETAFEWKGYMEGAVRSGERGAREVLVGLGEGGRGIGASL